MEEFKVKLKTRIKILLIMGIVAVILVVYHIVNSVLYGVSEPSSLGSIFLMGMFALAYTFRLSRALKDEKQLKLLYNKENDERLKAIRSKAGMPMLLITSLLIMAVGVVASYFNSIIFYTLFAAALGQLIIGVIVKLYCMKKM